MNTKKHHTHGGDAEAAAIRLGLPDVPTIKLDFSVNINPLGPPPALRHVLLHGVDIAAQYPEPYAEGAVRALAEAHGASPEKVRVGNGATEIFGWLLQALRPRSAAMLQPCYTGYAEACRAYGVDCVDYFPETARRGLPDYSEELLAGVTEDVVFVGNPNNPTGHLTDPDVLLRSARMAPRQFFVVDESFIDFTAEDDNLSLVGTELPENILVVKSLTKFFAIPGLRLGMAYAQANVIERLKAAQLPWSVNGLAQTLAPKLYADDDYLLRSRRTTAELRARLARELDQFPQLTVHEAAANFLLVKLAPPWTGTQLQTELLKRGILVRTCDSFPGLSDQYLRLAARPDPERREFVKALKTVFSAKTEAPAPSRTPRPAVMVVGTTSNAGKSMVAVGLCRALARRGLSVAPFKAQNMALNSFVTEDGGEMGRAQVVQARAAGLAPHTDMNPVLLKPTGDKGSQVIVNGQAIGTYGARGYYTMKESMRERAHQAYDRLCQRYDTIVLEGAGSPAEINLQAEDFVNMDMAHYAGARTILVADIDRGGVFATILGTISLMPPHHRRLLAGVLINK
ncbi:MAG: cobyric acid synthase, partial [Verrucomicrobiota bacterium]